eukprot:SM000007S20856  [mRNA]  locus=s7:679972:682988:+ [translate_table: standard]
MKGLFKHKPKGPAELVRATRDLLQGLDAAAAAAAPRDPKLAEKAAEELAKHVYELKVQLYGDTETSPSPDIVAQLTTEAFRDNFVRMVILGLPRMEYETRRDATQVLASLMRQQVNSRYIASDYLSRNCDLLDLLLLGYERQDLALLYGSTLRDAVRHQAAAKCVLDSPNFERLFTYIQLPNFDVASDAVATFKDLLTRHRSTVQDFLTRRYDWFFERFNKLLESPEYIIRRQMTELLADMLSNKANINVVVQYVQSLANLRILMNLLKDSSKSIQLEAFHVFKIFVANGNKPPEVANTLANNKEKLLRFLQDFKLDKENKQFEEDKKTVMIAVEQLPAVHPSSLQRTSSTNLNGQA